MEQNTLEQHSVQIPGSSTGSPHRGRSARGERGSFAGHETFPFRFGWMPRAVKHVLDDAEAFAREDAIVRFGVGKNMVRSIRHWALCTGLLEEVPESRGRPLSVTPLGRFLFHPDRGKDRYFEDPGTAWLLHWEVASRPAAATTWFWVFNHAPQLTFTRSELSGWLGSFSEQKGWRRVGDVSLKRDIDTFLRTYVPVRSGRNVGTEDSIDCPLVELGVVRESGTQPGAFSLVRSAHAGLPELIFGYALVQQLRHLPDGPRTVPMQAVAFAPGSPGRTFCLSEDAVLARLERVAELTGGKIVFDDTAGMRQLLIKELPDPQELLTRHYSATRGAR